MRGEVNKGEILQYLNKNAEKICGFVYEAKKDILLSRRCITKGPEWDNLLDGADKIYFKQDVVPIVTVRRGDTEYIMMIITRTNKNICSKSD